VKNRGCAEVGGLNVGSICVTLLRLLIQNLWHLTWWYMKTEAV
jgi:hypothetical protein